MTDEARHRLARAVINIVKEDLDDEYLTEQLVGYALLLAEHGLPPKKEAKC